MPSRRYETPVAITTARATRLAPVRRATPRGRSPRTASAVARCENTNSAPKSRACSYARDGELAPAHAAREPEVVADPGARRCLSAERVRLDHQGPQPFGGAVDARRRAPPARRRRSRRRTRSASGRVRTPSASAIARVSGSTSTRPSKRIATGRRVGSSAVLAQERRARLGVRGVEAERDAVAGEQVAQLVAARRPLLADDPEVLVARPVRARPRAQRLLDLRVEPLLRRDPSLQDPRSRSRRAPTRADAGCRCRASPAESPMATKRAPAPGWRACARRRSSTPSVPAPGGSPPRARPPRPRARAARRRRAPPRGRRGPHPVVRSEPALERLRHPPEIRRPRVRPRAASVEPVARAVPVVIDSSSDRGRSFPGPAGAAARSTPRRAWAPSPVRSPPDTSRMHLGPLRGHRRLSTKSPNPPAASRSPGRFSRGPAWPTITTCRGHGVRRRHSHGAHGPVAHVAPTRWHEAYARAYDAAQPEPGGVRRARWSSRPARWTGSSRRGSRPARLGLRGPGPRPDDRGAGRRRPQVRLTNRLPEPTAIHWHGLRLPARDGRHRDGAAPRAARARRFDVPLRAARRRHVLVPLARQRDGADRARALRRARRPRRRTSRRSTPIACWCSTT